VAEERSRSLRYWRAVASLPADRNGALGEIEACFLSGEPVERLDGPMAGRLITTTFGYGLDRVFMGLASLWMPWKGKELDPEAKEGRNIFASSFRAPMRLLWPSYRDQRPANPGRLTTFRFTTWAGAGKLHPDLEVFKIDYDLPDSPALLIRDILDELVQIEEGLYLGQALLRWRGRYRRVAWFQLEG
jgi:hypothetical protein